MSNVERSMLCIKLSDRQRNLDIRKRTQVIDAAELACKLKRRWAGHVARARDGRWSVKAAWATARSLEGRHRGCSRTDMDETRHGETAVEQDGGGLHPKMDSPWFYYVIPIVIGACYFYFYVFSLFWLLFVRYSITEDFSAMAVAISITAGSLTSVSKFLFMKLHESHIREIVEKFLSFDAQFVTETRCAINLRKHLRIVKKRALIVWIFLAANGAIYCIMPFVTPGRHFTADSYIVYGLEPMLESPNYEIAHILNNMCVAYSVYITINVAVYVTVMVGYNEAQLFTISEELRNLWDDSQNFYNTMKHQIRNKRYAIHFKEKIVNKYIRTRLKTIVHNHATNIKLFEELNNRLSDKLVVEYSIMVIALLAQLLGGLENTYIAMPYTLVQISIDCLSGQRLIDACQELENEIYSCEWENFNVSDKKTILLMLLISQKTLMLSAGGMADLNFSFLMDILKSTYSVYTTLKSSIQD
ncbi:odorant receptor 2a-like [Maniola hyperantus]|uniref:odorant receptor 2a-like n=1 Tax=Aphantopus hyperantus TaxID=2795564 RepID=UPI003747F5AA